MIPKKDCTKTFCPLCESRCQAGSTDSGFIENNGVCFRCVFGKSKEEIQVLLLAKEKLKQERLEIEIEIEKDSDELEVSSRWINRDTDEGEVSIFAAHFAMNTIWFDCKNGGGRSDVSVIEFLKTYKPKLSGSVKNSSPQTLKSLGIDLGKDADKSSSIVMPVGNYDDEQAWTGTSDSFGEAYNDAMDRINKYEMARESFLDDTPVTVNNKAKTKPKIKPWTRWVTINASEETELTVIDVDDNYVEFIYHSRYGNNLNTFEIDEFLSRYRPIGVIGIDDQLGTAIHELKRAIDNDSVVSLVKAAYRILGAIPTSEVSE